MSSYQALIEQNPAIGEALPASKRWIKGMPSPNPSGKIQTSVQPPEQRAKILLAKYSPQQIMAFAKDIKKAPLSTPDAIIVMHLANVLNADGLERERLYDRTFGKVPDRAININLNLDSTPEQMSERALALLGELLPAETIDTEQDCDLIEE